MSTWIFTDLHGNYSLLRRIFKYIKDSDQVYCLGDCIDRGYNSIWILKDLIERKNVTFIRGNHEQMFLDVCQNPENLSFKSPILSDYLLNGGGPTLNGFLLENSKTQESILSYLEKSQIGAVVPFTTIKGDKLTALLSHAGFTPMGNQKDKELLLHSSYDLLWDRKHIRDTYNFNAIKDYKDTFIIHGHTPIQYLQKSKNMLKFREDGAYHYCYGHKIDLDAMTPYTSSAILLELETGTEIVISTFSKKDLIFSNRKWV